MDEGLKEKGCFQCFKDTEMKANHNCIEIIFLS